ncbi:hypothetical protein CEXT_675331 [Caerostris extrusa]|uniref:Uncharacterized protein n=1 Tax=Caerostris extrusa TaxID=172846 RepID=A0AAV4U9Q9_CAEEX|nr:hypothetical protein CEXT_675331 [Caerostris extrusa]
MKICLHGRNGKNVDLRVGAGANGYGAAFMKRGKGHENNNSGTLETPVLNEHFGETIEGKVWCQQSWYSSSHAYKRLGFAEVSACGQRCSAVGRRCLP